MEDLEDFSDASSHNLGSPLLSSLGRATLSSDDWEQPGSLLSPGKKSPRSPKSTKGSVLKTPSVISSSKSKSSGRSSGKRLTSAEKLARIREQKRSSEKKIAKARKREKEEGTLFPGTVSPPGSPRAITEVRPLASSPLNLRRDRNITRMQKRMEAARLDAIESDIAATKDRLAEDRDDCYEEILPPPPPTQSSEDIPFEDSIITAGLVTAASIEQEVGKRAALELDEEHLSYLRDQYAYKEGGRKPDRSQGTTGKEPEQMGGEGHQDGITDDTKIEEEVLVPPLSAPGTPIDAGAADDAFSPLFGASRTKSDIKEDESFSYSPAASSAHPSPDKSAFGIVPADGNEDDEDKVDRWREEGNDGALEREKYDSVNVVLFGDDIEISREDLDYIQSVEDLLQQSHSEISREELGLEDSEEQEKEEEDGEGTKKDAENGKGKGGNSSRAKKTTSTGKAKGNGKSKRKSKSKSKGKRSSLGSSGRSASTDSSPSAAFASTLDSTLESIGIREGMDQSLLSPSPQRTHQPLTPQSTSTAGSAASNRFGFSPSPSRLPLPSTARSPSGVLITTAADTSGGVINSTILRHQDPSEISLARGLLPPPLIPILHANEPVLFYLFTTYATGPGAPPPPIHSSAARSRPSSSQRCICCFTTDNAWTLLFDWGVAPEWISRVTLRKLVEAVVPLTGRSAADSGSFTMRNKGSEGTGSGRKSKIPIKTTPTIIKTGTDPSSSSPGVRSGTDGKRLSKSPLSVSKEALSSPASGNGGGMISFDEWLLLLVWLVRERQEGGADDSKEEGQDGGGTTQAQVKAVAEDERDDKAQAHVLKALLAKMDRSDGKANLHRRKGFHLRLTFNV